MILGLAGTFASGKDTLGVYLEQHHGFMHVSTGDIVREVAMTKYGNAERETLRTLANELRSTRGPGVLVELALERYEMSKDLYPGGVVISGIRSIGEAERLTEAEGKLIFVDSPIEIRYERIQKRHRANEDRLNFEEFKESEAKELQFGDPADKTVQNIGVLRKMANMELTNTDDLEAFFADARIALGL